MSQNNKNVDDEIELTQIIKVLWKRKIFILMGVLIFTVASILVSFLLPKSFESNGVYILSESELEFELEKEDKEDIKHIMTIPQFKEYRSSFYNNINFASYLKKKNININKKDKEKIEEMLIKEENILDENIVPIYAHSKKDLQEIVQTKSDFTNYVIGVKISFEYINPKTAQQMVYELGSFLRDSIMFEKLKIFIKGSLSNAKTELDKNRNDLIDGKFELKQLEIKKKELEAIEKKYPEAKGIENRQVVSVERGGQIYLSPISQLVGVESLIVDWTVAINKSKRNIEKAEIELEFFSKAEGILKIDNNGEELFGKLIALKKDFFEDRDLNQDTEMLVENSLTIEIENFNRQFNSVFKFSPFPSLPEKRTKPKRMLIIVISFFLSIVVFIFLALMIEWWEKNRGEILS